MYLRDLVRSWIDEREIDCAPTTVGWYRSMAKYLEPLGEVDPGELDRHQVNALLRDLKAKDYSNHLARGVVRTLTGALKSEGIVIPGVRIPPRPKRAGRKGTWTGTDTVTFLSYVSSDRLAAGWSLAVVAGLRRGELGALTWSAVDLADGLVYVREQRTVANGRPGVLTCEPKGTSTRVIPIGPGMVDLLRRRKAGWEEDRRRSRGGWKGGSYVMAMVNGKPYHPHWLSHRWNQLCQAAGVPVIALHDSRHTSATLSAMAGVDIKTLQSRLGHSDAKILTNIYLHLVTEAGRQAAVTIEQSMGLATPKAPDPVDLGDLDSDSL